MIRRCNIAIYYRLLIYSNLVIGSKVLDENGFCSFNGGWNYLFSVSSDTTKYYHIFDNHGNGRTKMGRVGLGQ